ncbi:HEPN domain-containing protein [Pseudomonadales bacterium]|nr:HEPN domain-containing protein [Pseudomonadales bacterium]
MHAESLKVELRESREAMTSDHAVRLHRALSWLLAAEKYSASDDDISFVNLWISFNACYAIGNKDDRERDRFTDFTKKIVLLDKEEAIYQCIWNNYSSFVRLLINNHYVFGPFWHSQKAGNSDWEKKFSHSKKIATHSLANSNVPVLLSIILDRLYILRNQLIHGGSTHNSKVNRDQVINGKKMLLELMPIFIKLMMMSEDDWGEVEFPVID